MALTPIQKLELNKRVDRIFHAPSNAPARGHQPEIAFVTDVSGDIDAVHSSVRCRGVIEGARQDVPEYAQQHGVLGQGGDHLKSDTNVIYSNGKCI